ncbi:hypothetical protein EI555_016635, partial [Monodon monoceros]
MQTNTGKQTLYLTNTGLSKCSEDSLRKSIENKDTETNLQSKIWSPSFLKESTGEMSKNVVITEQEKNDECSPEDSDDKLSESTDDGGEDDTNDEDNEEDSNPNKDTHAPLELMTETKRNGQNILAHTQMLTSLLIFLTTFTRVEFLRSEMGQDYHLAKKLCQKILIYEPENPEAKEFSSLIEEMLLM